MYKNKFAILDKNTDSQSDDDDSDNFIFIKSKKNDKKIIKYINLYENNKKILCNHFLNGEKCIYSNKCVYAHSFDEQKVDYPRKLAYDMIINMDNLSDIDLAASENYNLLKILILFTRYCSDCQKMKCPGGKNCKYGVFNKNYMICYKDLIYGDCLNTDEDHPIHLTNKGLIPKNIRLSKNNKFLMRDFETNEFKFTIPMPVKLSFEYFESIDSFAHVKVDDTIYDSCDESIFS